MAKATQAILHHYSSTETNLKHKFCPTGSDSWCSYQRDLANGTNLHKPIKNPFPPAIVSVIKPLFDRLGDEKFLAGCEKCVTQNANESLHHVICGLCPKEQYNSPQECSLAVSLGVLLFNSGMEVIYPELLCNLDLTVTPRMIKTWRKVDNKRVRDGEYKEREEVKVRRRKFKNQKAKKADAFIHIEGLQYKSQGFYDTEQPKTSKQKAVCKGKSKGKATGKGKA